MSEVLLAAVGSGIALGGSNGLSPGPLSMLAISHTLQGGFSRGLKAACAPLISDIPIVIFSLLVFYRYSQSTTFLAVVSFIGALSLVYLGYLSLSFEGESSENGNENVKPMGDPLLQGILTNLFNPYPYLFWITVGGPYASKLFASHGYGAVLFILAFYAGMLAAKMAVIGAVLKSRKFITGPKYRMCVRGIGWVLLFFGAKFAVQGVTYLRASQESLAWASVPPLVAPPLIVPGVTVVPVGVAALLTEMESSSSIVAGDYVRKAIHIALTHYAPRLESKKLQIKLEEFDYSNTDLAALKTAKAAVGSDVVVVHGYEFSSQALIAAPVHQQGGLPMVTSTSTADRISTFGKYVHQVPMHNSYQAQVLAKFARKKLKARKSLVVVAQDCAYCENLQKNYVDEFKKLGGETVGLFPILSGDQDFAKIADEARRLKPDVVFLPNYEVLSARIISSFLSAGVHVPFIGGDGWTTFGERFFEKTLSDRKFEAYSIGHWRADSNSPSSSRFKKDFEKAYGVTPNDAAALSYDGMCMILEAILNARSSLITRQAVEEQLVELRDFRGATGRLSLRAGFAQKRSVYLRHITSKGFSYAGDLSEVL